MKSWSELGKEAHAEFRRVVEIIGKIFFHGLLVLIWFGLDRLVGLFLHKFETHDAHDMVVIAFRWLASIVIFVLAAAPAVSDIIEAIASVMESASERFGIICRACPYKPSGLDAQNE